MSITLSSLSKATKDSLLVSLQTEREELQSRLNAIDADILSLTPPKPLVSLRADGSARTTWVRSETRQGHWYAVRRLNNGKYDCKCQSFEFGQGLDSRGHCKHIRSALQEGLI